MVNGHLDYYMKIKKITFKIVLNCFRHHHASKIDFDMTKLIINSRGRGWGLYILKFSQGCGYTLSHPPLLHASRHP